MSYKWTDELTSAYLGMWRTCIINEKCTSVYMFSSFFLFKLLISIFINIVPTPDLKLPAIIIFPIYARFQLNVS